MVGRISNSPGSAISASLRGVWASRFRELAVLAGCGVQPSAALSSMELTSHMYLLSTGHMLSLQIYQERLGPNRKRKCQNMSLIFSMLIPCYEDSALDILSKMKYN